MPDNPWQWLRTHEPESYEQLVEKLRQEVDGLHGTARFVRDWLADVFEWCGEHGIELAELDVSPNLHKHREATAYMRGIKTGDEPDEVKVRLLREVIERIKRDPNRDATRRWARGLGRTPPLGHMHELAMATGRQFEDEDTEVLEIRGSSVTIQQIRAAIKRFVDWGG